MDRTIIKTAALGFVAGALGVIIFHQALILILHVAGVIPSAPYSFAPTKPFGVPQLFSLAFFGGLWGIALMLLMTRIHGADRLWVAVLFGGILLPLTGILIVTPLKGGTVADALEFRRLALGFFINGFWGLGTVFSYRVLRRSGS